MNPTKILRAIIKSRDHWIENYDKAFDGTIDYSAALAEKCALCQLIQMCRDCPMSIYGIGCINYLGVTKSFYMNAYDYLMQYYFQEIKEVEVQKKLIEACEMMAWSLDHIYYAEIGRDE